MQESRQQRWRPGQEAVKKRQGCQKEEVQGSQDGASQSARRGDKRLLRPLRGAELWVCPRFKCGCTVEIGPLRS